MIVVIELELFFFLHYTFEILPDVVVCLLTCDFESTLVDSRVDFLVHCMIMLKFI